MVLRPVGETLHAIEPNQLIHCDFMAVQGGYVHVIVDDASRFCQLTWHDVCKAFDAVEALQLWFATFGIVPVWMSDQGPHYKNEIMRELRRLYGSAHNFSPAYCPWVNGTVEVMMRSIRKTLKTMLVELRLSQDQAHILLPIVQHALNHTPCAKNGGIAPITAMTQLPAGNALSAYKRGEEVVDISEETLSTWRKGVWRDLADARDKLHRRLADVASTKRARERARRNKKSNVRRAYFEVGDYVLVGKISGGIGNKLAVTWLGPRRIIRSHSDWVFDVEDLRNGVVRQHHVSRMKPYAAKDAAVTQDLIDHIAFVDGGHEVEEFVDCKFDRSTKQWMLLVKWRGLEDLEKSWEPVLALLEDVPEAVRKFAIKRAHTSKNVKRMADVHGLRISLTAVGLGGC
ncbi:hypothetical protein LEN26_019240 [Aphanomyces euteiches]|nr:hypothetical protein LEN26_019240 [Aphanomyces euteiches]